jgi:hypothetical protein
VEAITFNGTAEWALDYLVLTEAIWVPHEAQLRGELEERLVKAGGDQPVLTLATTSDGYTCQIMHGKDPHAFEAFVADEAYAAALLFILNQAS